MCIGECIRSWGGVSKRILGTLISAISDSLDPVTMLEAPPFWLGWLIQLPPGFRLFPPLNAEVTRTWSHAGSCFLQGCQRSEPRLSDLCRKLLYSPTHFPWPLQSIFIKHHQSFRRIIKELVELSFHSFHNENTHMNLK